MSSQEDRPRTTLTGQPIKYEHDALTSVAAGDAGFSSAGGNRLPVGYTDDSVVRVPIKLSDIPDWDAEAPLKPEKKNRFLRKMSGSVRVGGKVRKEEIKVVPMRRADYLKYWAKGDEGIPWSHLLHLTSMFC